MLFNQKGMSLLKDKENIYSHNVVTAIIIMMAVLYVTVLPSTITLNVGYAGQPILTIDVCKSPSGFISSGNTIVVIPENYFCFQCISIESSISSVEEKIIPQVYPSSPEKPPRIA
ncbi:MAG: hypothetical protein AB1348_09010 [Nitrospirota bacterium]